MNYMETSAKTGKNVEAVIFICSTPVQAFQELTQIVYKKIEDKTIDVTNECYGVRLGTGMPSATKEGSKKVTLGQEKIKKDGECGC